MQSVDVKLLSATAILPKRQTSGSAGYDLYADVKENVIIAPGETFLVPTGIALGISDHNIAAFVYARSGIASKFNVAPANCVGVIDSDYRGEVCVALHNSGNAPFEIKHGDRIAQLVFAPVFLPELTVCDELEETKRGSGGFGSTAI